MSEVTEFTIEQGSIQTGDRTVKVTVEGESNMPFWHHDLKVKAVLALLNSIDIKHYYEDGLQDEAFRDVEKVIETAKAAFGLDLFE
ncbi:hypothetical protein ABE042_12190 [Viridibacillus arvi]|uniref:hypothetical protein n=1 Tax=Viridibacillus arvi TaxID=263475 RepID=UPI003D2A6480